MKFIELINIVKERNDGKMFNISVPGKFNNFEISGITNDSRLVKKDYIFMSVKGYKDDGDKYISAALEAGAGAVFTESEYPGEKIVRVNEIRKLTAVISSEINGNPAGKLKIIGITGTNGKTTITYLIRHLLEKHGKRCGLIGTIDYLSGKKKQGASLTTPDSPQIHEIFREMAEEGIGYCIMEASSIALLLNRVYTIDFSGAVFTNLTSEHLDLHKNMDNYFEAKKILFDGLNENSFALSNCDDKYGEKILEDTKAEKIFYSLEKESGIRAKDIKLNISGLEFSFNGIQFKSNLTGRFNVYNILAAIGAAYQLGIDYETSAEYLKTFEPVNGRFNSIRLQNGAYAVIDYSHTSDSLENAINAANDIMSHKEEKGKVITVFGCGGNKDRIKRPEMGRIAVSNSDFVIITSDNPRFEEPMDIINEILTGIDKKYENYIIEENRELAIKKAIEISKEGDIILVCGKGHETYQEIKGIRTHFDDKEEVQKYGKLLEK